MHWYNYMGQVIVTYEKESLPTKRFIKETCQEFYDFAEEYIIMGQPYEIKELLNEYNYEYAKKDIKQNTLTKWLKLYAPVKDYNLGERRTDGGRAKIVTLEPMLKRPARLKGFDGLNSD